MKRSQLIYTLVPLIFAGGCANESLFFATKSSIGVDVSTSNGAPRANIGYDRTEVAIVPPKEDGSTYSVVGGIDADLSFANVRIKELFATGNAAKVVASKSTLKSKSSQATSTGKPPALETAAASKQPPSADGKKFIQPVIFGADASLGLLNIQINNNGLPGFGSLLYRRSEATLIPVKPGQEDAASVYADISIDTMGDSDTPTTGLSWVEQEVEQHPTRFSGLGFGVRIVQSFATGEAAELLVEDSDIKDKLKKATKTKSASTKK